LSRRATAIQRELKRILVVRTDRLGDVILTLPMLSALRSCFPTAHLAMLVRRYTGEIACGNPNIDEIIWYDTGERLVPFAEMTSTIRERAFDAVVIVHPTFRLAFMMFRAKVPLRIGTGYRYYSLLLNRRVYEHRKDAQRHELEYNLSLLQELHCDVPANPDFGITVSDEAQRNIHGLFRALSLDESKQIVVVHPGTGGSAREWPVGYFGQLAARLIEKDKAVVVITGRRGEERKAAEVLLATKGGAIPLVGRLNLMELAALIRSSSVFVSNSTGPLHLAVAMKTPVVCMYPQLTPMSARRWGPYTERKRVFVPDKPASCRQCSGRSTEQCLCMASITVEQVYYAVKEFLGEPILQHHGT
jgi:heptosyltransferase-3